MHTNVLLTEDEKIVLISHNQQFAVIKSLSIEPFRTFLNDKTIQYMKDTGDYSILYQLLNNPISRVMINDYDLYFIQKRLISDVLLKFEVNYGPLMFTKLMKDISSNDTYTLTNINNTAEIFTFKKTEDNLYKVYIPEFMIFDDPIIQYKNKSRFTDKVLIGTFSFYKLAEFLKAIFNFRQNIPISELKALESELLDDNKSNNKNKNDEKSAVEHKEEKPEEKEIKKEVDSKPNLSFLISPVEGAGISSSAPSLDYEAKLSKLEQKIDEIKEYITNNISANIQIDKKQILDTILGITEIDDETYEKLQQSPIINAIIQMINGEVRHIIEISSRSLFHDIEREVKNFTKDTQEYRHAIEALQTAFRAHTSKIDAVEIAAGSVLFELQNLTKIVKELKEKVDNLSINNTQHIDNHNNQITNNTNPITNTQSTPLVNNPNPINSNPIQQSNTNNIITTNTNLNNNSNINAHNNNPIINQTSSIQSTITDSTNESTTAVLDNVKQETKVEETIISPEVIEEPQTVTEVETNTDENKENLSLAELVAQELSTQLDDKYKENIIKKDEDIVQEIEEEKEENNKIETYEAEQKITTTSNEVLPEKIKEREEKPIELKPLKIKIKDNDLMHKYFTLKALLKDVRFDTPPNEQINTAQIKEKNKQLPQQQYMQNAIALLNALPIYVDTQNVYNYIELLDNNDKETIEQNINTITEFLIALTLKYYFLNNAKNKSVNNIIYMLYRYIIETRLGENLYKALSYAYKKSGEALTGHGTLPHLAYQLQLIPMTLLKMFKHDVSVQFVFKFVKDYVSQYGYDKYYDEIFHSRLNAIINDFNDKYNFKYFDRQANNTNDEFVDTFVRSKIISFEDLAEINEFATPEEYAFKINPDKLFEKIKSTANAKFNTNTINDLHNYVMEAYHNARQNMFFTLQNDYCKTFNDLIEKAPIHPNIFRIVSNDNSQLAKLESYSTFKHIIELIRKSAAQPIPEIIEHEEELFVDDKINFIVTESIKSILEFIGYDIHEKCELKNTNDLAYQQLEEIKNLFNTNNLKDVLEDFIDNSQILKEDKIYFDRNKSEMLRHTPKSIEHLFIIVSTFYKYTTDQNRRNLILKELREYLEKKYNIGDITKYMKLHPLALSRLIEEIRDDLVELDSITRTLNDTGSSAQKLYELYLNIMSKLSITYLFDKVTRKIINELIADILKDKTCGVYKYIKP